MKLRNQLLLSLIALFMIISLAESLSLGKFHKHALKKPEMRQAKAKNQQLNQKTTLEAELNKIETTPGEQANQDQNNKDDEKNVQSKAPQAKPQQNEQKVVPPPPTPQPKPNEQKVVPPPPTPQPKPNDQKVVPPPPAPQPKPNDQKVVPPPANNDNKVVQPQNNNNTTNQTNQTNQTQGLDLQETPMPFTRCVQVVGIDGIVIHNLANIVETDRAHLQINAYTLNVFKKVNDPSSLLYSIDWSNIQFPMQRQSCTQACIQIKAPKEKKAIGFCFKNEKEIQQILMVFRAVLKCRSGEQITDQQPCPQVSEQSQSNSTSIAQKVLLVSDQKSISSSSCNCNKRQRRRRI